MTPLLKVNSASEALYNESQIRTRNCIERSYGVWKRRFPVLSLGIRMNVREVERVIIATAILHNVCNINKDRNAPPIYSDEMNMIIDTEVAIPPFSAAHQSDNTYRREIIQNHFERL